MLRTGHFEGARHRSAAGARHHESVGKAMPMKAMEGPKAITLMFGEHLSSAPFDVKTRFQLEIHSEFKA